MASVIEKFDEEDREMAQALLEQYWIIRGYGYNGEDFPRPAAK